MFMGDIYQIVVCVVKETEQMRETGEGRGTERNKHRKRAGEREREMSYVSTPSGQDLPLHFCHYLM